MMTTMTNDNFELMEKEELATLVGGNCTWGGLGKAALQTGAGNGLRLGLKTRTVQGAVGGTIGGAIVGGVGYGATCWW